MKQRKLLQKILSGSANIPIRDFVAVIEAYGFRLQRTAGSHRIFARSGVAELINVQDVKGKAKPYQIRQFLELVEQYDLSLEDET